MCEQQKENVTKVFCNIMGYGNVIKHDLINSLLTVEYNVGGVKIKRIYNKKGCMLKYPYEYQSFLKEPTLSFI